jgi:hypothetical protein
LTADEPWRPSFSQALRRVYPKLTSLSDKPIAVLEFGSRQGRRKAAWFRNALRTLGSGRFRRVKAASVWSEAWTNGNGSVSDLKIDSDPLTLRTYRRLAGRPVFTSRPRFRPR